MTSTPNAKRISELEADNRRLNAEIEQLKHDHQVLEREHRRARSHLDLALSTNHHLGVAAAANANSNWVRTEVFRIVRHLASFPDQVASDRSLGELSVPVDTLARDLDNSFFGGQRVIKDDTFDGGTLVGNVVNTVRAKLHSH